MNKLADDCFNQVEDLMSMSQALEILQQRIVIVTGDRLDRLPLARPQPVPGPRSRPCRTA